MRSEKTRNSNIELLRILAMIMVFMFHFAGHADGGSIMKQDFSANQFLIFCLGSWGTVANCIFFAISSYFLLNNAFIDLGKLISLFLKISVIGSGLYVFFCIESGGGIDLIALIKSMLGIYSYQYWFMSAYFVLMVISPALNMVVKKAGKPYYRILLIVGFTAVSLSPGRAELMGRISVAAVTYLLIGYCEKYVDDGVKYKYCRWISFVLISAIILYECVCSILNSDLPVGIFLSANSPTAIIGGISLFYTFHSFRIKNNRLINFLGKHAMGAYLLNFPSVVPRQAVWDGILCAGYIYRLGTITFLAFYILAAVVFTLCGMLMDWLYDCSFGKVLLRIGITKKRNIYL